MTLICNLHWPCNGFIHQAVFEDYLLTSIEMALEEDIAELDTVLDDLNEMMKDLNVRSVLEFFPTNNNEAFQDILHSEMDADGPAGRLLKSLTKEDVTKSISRDMEEKGSSEEELNYIAFNSPINSIESLPKKSSSTNCFCDGSSSSVSYDENMVNLGSCSDQDSNVRFNSIEKLRNDSNCSEDSAKDCEIFNNGHTQLNGSDFHKVTVYFQGRSFELDIPSKATARDVTLRIVIINRLEYSNEWTLFECLNTYDLERNLEDHELVLDIISKWENEADCRLLMKSFTKKYEFFEKPAFYIPSYILSNDDRTKADTLRAGDGWLPEYDAYLTVADRIPPLENFLNVKRYRKKSWKRKHCVLRASGIFSSSKSGFTRSSREVKCNVNFSSTKLYLTSPYFNESHSAPSNHCFCFVPDGIINPEEIKCICAESEQVMQSWILGYRLAKFGSRLYRNYKIATQDKRAARTVSAPVAMDTVVRRKRPSIDYRVPIDFSGNESRVVSDPDAAQAVKDSILSKLPKRLKRRSTGSYHSPYSSGIPPVFEKPWFHGKLEREQATKILRSAGMEEGLFLVRESCTSSGVNVISVVKKKKILHHQVFQAVGEGQIFYGLEHGPRFQSLDQLIEFYQNYRHGGKASLLRRPCKRVDKYSVT